MSGWRMRRLHSSCFGRRCLRNSKWSRSSMGARVHKHFDYFRESFYFLRLQNCCLLRTLSAHHRSGSRLLTVFNPHMKSEHTCAALIHSHSALSRRAHNDEIFVFDHICKILFVCLHLTWANWYTADGTVCAKTIAKQNTLDSISSFA